MGGAVLGHALARAGKRVLFCEKGRSLLADGRDGALRGRFAEEFFDRPEAPDTKHAEILAKAGRWCDVIEDRSGPRTRRFIPFIGAYFVPRTPGNGGAGWRVSVIVSPILTSCGLLISFTVPTWSKLSRTSNV